MGSFSSDISAMKLFIILSLCVSALSTVHAEGGGGEPDEYWSKCLSKRYGDPSRACRSGYKRLAKARKAGVVSGCNYWEWKYFCSKTHTKAYWQGTFYSPFYSLVNVVYCGRPEEPRILISSFL